MSLMERFVEERYWGVPLSLMPCTVERRMAVHFSERITSQYSEMKRNKILLRVNVAALKDENFAVDSSRFSSNVVTPICVVDISNLSELPAEREVGLREPFRVFQLLGISNEERGEKNTLFILDVLVFNTNTDHPSTMETSDEGGDRARVLFSYLVEEA